MFPADLCVDFDITRCQWFHWLFQDAGYLQCAIFTASATQDFVCKQSITPGTYSHLRKTIALLNDNLSSNDSAVSIRDSTLSTVIMLAMFSCMMNDHNGAKAHVAGLREMVRLRGGLEAFRDNSKLYIKLGR